ncbi:T-cell surface glycoprotein CD8 alpha chain-like [Hemitrygon akajei]|uniref:T-cell surface glycoprotein CD8 alpha chain-like n=1 Tax=Hemitrygon akajei TaxID=2704970 RepID=UPI003BF97F28
MKIIGFFLVVHLTSTTQSGLPSGIMVKKGEKAVIDCSLKANEGVYWFFQPENSKLKFLLYLSGANKIISNGDNRLDSTRSFSKVSLTVNSFTKEDSGKYYCVMVRNMKMEFGDMVARYLEEIKTTPKATTVVTSTKVTTTTPSAKTSCAPTESRFAKKEDKMSCHLFIWAPLVCAASLLLLVLIFVSVLDCKRPRRRRCQHQFRKRPIPEDIRRQVNSYH